MPENHPFPLPPREMRASLGLPEDIDEGTIQDLFYGKPSPPPDMKQMFSPLQMGREALPTAVEAGALVGGGILAGGGGVPGIIAAGGLNVFGRHLANKMRAINEGQLLPDKANPASVSTDFIMGAMQAMIPVAKGPLGFVQQGITQAGIGQAENLMEGKPLSMQQAGEQALGGAAMHGAFQGAGKLASKVLPLRTEAAPQLPTEGQRAPLTTMLAGERGSALMGNLKPPQPNEMGFYSRLKHFTDNLPDNASHNPLGMANQLQKGVTSKLELDETGVLPWLREQKGKVTSQQIRDYVDQHQIKVEEKMLGTQPSDKDSKRIDELSNKLDLTDAEKQEYYNLTSRSSHIQPKYDRPETLTPFEHGAEPGSYRELVMTLPQATMEIPGRTGWNEVRQASGNKKWYRVHSAEGWAEWDIAPYNTREEATANLDKQTTETVPDESKTFTSGHYSDIPNPLLHMRFDSRISPDGKKTLFLQEIQSDWHQKGKKEGYQGIEPRLTLPPGYTLKQEGFTHHVYDQNGYHVSLGETAEEATQRAIQRVDQEQYDQRFLNKQRVPNAPFKQTTDWVALGLKRLLRYAAENGYDRIAWTPGEAQAERYDLSKQVDAIKYDIASKTGEYAISVKRKGEDGYEGIGLFQKSKLPDVVGKELAEKIISQGENSHEYHGLDLKVGGEGMTGFYGSPEKNNLGIVGGVMNDIGKKWGTRVGASDFDIQEKVGIDNNPYLRKEADDRVAELNRNYPEFRYKVVPDTSFGAGYFKIVKTTKYPKVHSLDLPDNLKQDVKQKGQPIASISDVFPSKERQA